MKIYLLLRGAWLWRKLTAVLEKEEAGVIAYDLPGHGKRAAERSGVNMSSYVNDVLSYDQGAAGNASEIGGKGNGVIRPSGCT